MNKDNIKFIMVGVMSLNGYFYSDKEPLKDWRGDGDIKDFANITKSFGTVVMGIATALTLPDVKPLKDRNNIVLVNDTPILYKNEEQDKAIDLLRNNGFMVVTVSYKDLNRELLIERLMNWGIDLHSEAVAVIGGPKTWNWLFEKNVIDEVWLHIARTVKTSASFSHVNFVFGYTKLRETAPKLAYKNWVSYLVEKKE